MVEGAQVFQRRLLVLRVRKDLEDDRLTERVKKACELMRIYLLDHVIVTESNYYSYREKGRL